MSLPPNLFFYATVDEAAIGVTQGQRARTGGGTGAEGTAGSTNTDRDHFLPLSLLISLPLCIPLFFLS